MSEHEKIGQSRPLLIVREAKLLITDISLGLLGNDNRTSSSCAETFCELVPLENPQSCC